MQSKYQLDNVKFNHWLNIRKMTYDVLNEHLSGKVNYKINKNNSDQLDRFSIDKIAEVLEIPTSYLLKDEETPVFLFKTKEEIEKNPQSGGLFAINLSVSGKPDNEFAG